MPKPDRLPGSAGVPPASLEPGWHSRGYLPHCENAEVQTLTFRLHDSLPQPLVQRWKEELGFPPPQTQAGGTPALPGNLPADDPRQIELRKRIDRYEDAGYGECLLRLPHIAQVVQSALLFFHGQRYRIIAWCIMPNHVHVMFVLAPQELLSSIAHSWKSYTSHKINRILGRSGQIWQEEFYDRFIRDEQHYQAAVRYIHMNPVKAGLCAHPTEWRWSSASYEHKQAGGTPALPGHEAGGTPALPGFNSELTSSLPGK